MNASNLLPWSSSCASAVRVTVVGVVAAAAAAVAVVAVGDFEEVLACGVTTTSSEGRGRFHFLRLDCRRTDRRSNTPGPPPRPAAAELPIGQQLDEQ